MSAISEQIDYFLRFVIAYIVMLALFLMNTVSLYLPFSGAFEIPLIAMLVFYWSIYRPTLIPDWLVFACGILFDILSGLPIGLNAFILLVLRWIVLDQRLFLMGQPFFVVWIGYSITCFAGCVLTWLLYGAAQLQLPPFAPVAMMVGAGILLFPLISFILHVTHRILPVDSDTYSVFK